MPNPLQQNGSHPPTPTDVEAGTTWAQVGRLLSGCRMFVPVYRQLPVLGLLEKEPGNNTDYGLGEQDLQQAWDQYWDHDNTDPITGRRRGVVLLGHSQGSHDLQTLIQHRIDGNPDATDHLVGAILLGANTIVPIGHDRGDGDAMATFQHLPLCHRPNPDSPVPTGCVVAFSTYNQPDGTLLVPNAIFGRADHDHEVACVNPAALLTGMTPDALTPVVAEVPSAIAAFIFPNATRRDFSTGLARYPGKLTAQCRAGADAHGTARWLQISGDDELAPPTDGTDIGLHIADWQLAQDEVDALIAAQTAAWIDAHTR